MWHVSMQEFRVTRVEYPHDISGIKLLWNFMWYGPKVILPGSINRSEVKSRIVRGTECYNFESVNDAVAFVNANAKGYEPDYTAKGVIVEVTPIVFSDTEMKASDVQRPTGTHAMLVRIMNDPESFTKSRTTKKIENYKTVFYFDCYGRLRKF